MTSIAIDGPGGAGKSTLSRAIAKNLGFVYVDTGALYRAVGLYLLRRGVSAEETEKVREELKFLSVDLRFTDGEQRVLLNGEDVSELIRTPEVSMMASAASALPDVRKFLFEQQRALAREHNVVMDGRDIGTVVLPDAQVKLFLTASPEDRARRRYEELLSKGAAVGYEEVLADLKQRDENDSNRAVAPLKPAEDALIVDTTGNTLEKSLELLLKIVKERL